MTVLPEKTNWLNNPDIQPYFFVRKENRRNEPGAYLKDCDWFKDKEVLQREPLSMKEEGFARLIMEVEGRAFQQSGMPMPGWVFYDCGLIPGIVTGFAYRTSKLPTHLREVIGEKFLTTEWTPLSLFIAIPCANRREWVAHNLSSINSLIPKEHRFYGMGFLSKAFGLWYSNIEVLCGMTQWESPALKLHANYGDFELLTAYTPVHSHPRTMTYKCQINFKSWEKFFLREENENFENRFKEAGFKVNPKDRESLIYLQTKLEYHRVENQGSALFLKPDELRYGEIGDPLNVYQRIEES